MSKASDKKAGRAVGKTVGYVARGAVAVLAGAGLWYLKTLFG